jgi:hypothetical protein
MINRAALLADLKRLVTTVQDDLRTRASSADVPEVGRRLADEYARAPHGHEHTSAYQHADQNTHGHPYTRASGDALFHHVPGNGRTVRRATRPGN